MLIWTLESTASWKTPELGLRFWFPEYVALTVPPWLVPERVSVKEQPLPAIVQEPLDGDMPPPDTVKAMAPVGLYPVLLVSAGTTVATQIEGALGPMMPGVQLTVVVVSLATSTVVVVV